MPLEIKELHIKVTVNQPNGQGEKPGAASSKQQGDSNGKEEIINQCIEEVMEIINNKKER